MILFDTVTDELEERGWDLNALAAASNVNPDTLYQVLYWDKPMTKEVAQGLAKAFGTSAELWLNLGKETQACE